MIIRAPPVWKSFFTVAWEHPDTQYVSISVRICYLCFSLCVSAPDTSIAHGLVLYRCWELHFIPLGSARLQETIFFTSDVPGSMVTVCSVRFSSTTVRILHTPEVLLEFIKGGTCPMVWDHLFFVSYIVFLRLDICYIYIYIVKHYMSKKIYNFKLEIWKKQAPCRMCQEKGRTGKAALNSDAQGGNEAGLAARATPPSAPQSTNRHSQGLPPLVASSVFLCGIRPVDCCGPPESWLMSKNATALGSCLLSTAQQLQAKHSAPNSFPITDDESRAAERCIKIF
jgi:hypothetical protein